MKVSQRFIVEVEFDNEVTDDESVATALDNLMGTAVSTPGIMDDYGVVFVGEFFPTSWQNPVTDEE